ncbi:MAG: HAD family hydrolase [Ignavibacteriae bacterium]|nr:MAG: HAD family hydrolase [Ignavibacteriota bacterium]
MKIKAISFDFWNTLFYDYKMEYNRHNARKKYFRKILDKHGHVPEMDLEPVFKYCWDYFDKVWKTEHKTRNARELLDLKCIQLGITLPEEDLVDIAKFFEEIMLEHPPNLFEGVKEILPKLAEKYKLGITSDTAYSSGRVLKILMERNDILKYFTAFTFSDEVGCSKPDGNAFRSTLVQFGVKPEEAAHVGDNEYTDVGGAKKTGMSAVWFKGAYERESYETIADYKANDWTDLARIFEV